MFGLSTLLLSGPFLLSTLLGCALNAEGDGGLAAAPGDKEKGEAKEHKLQQRLKSATLVVAGKVLSTKPAPAKKPLRISEHNANWHEAALQVQAVGKGQAPKEGKVTVFFPTSRDRLWAKAPRFKAGEEGIWILHRTRVDGAEAYTALDPLDFHPHREWGRIREMLKEAPKPE